MPIDPAAPQPITPDARRADKLADLDRRVAALERAHPVIQVLPGAPTTAPRDGTPAVDSSAVRLWVRVNGGWHFVTLT